MNNVIKYGKVEIQSKQICKSWWSFIWCKNIEKYTNSEARLSRGRTYARKGAIEELIIFDNMVKSVVKGTTEDSYEVTIQIVDVNSLLCESFLQISKKNPEAYDELYQGVIPTSFTQFFTNDSTGLIPKKNDIKYKCTCMDYLNEGHMCKHVLATLYAIANKLDDNPLILFKLRGLNTDKYLEELLTQENEFVWKSVNKEINRKVNQDVVSQMFGFDYQTDNSEINLDELFNVTNLETELEEVAEILPITKQENLIENNSDDDDFDYDDMINMFKEKALEFQKNNVVNETRPTVLGELESNINKSVSEITKDVDKKRVVLDVSLNDTLRRDEGNNDLSEEIDEINDNEEDNHEINETQNISYTIASDGATVNDEQTNEIVSDDADSENDVTNNQISAIDNTYFADTIGEAQNIFDLNSTKKDKRKKRKRRLTVGEFIIEAIRYFFGGSIAFVSGTNLLVGGDFVLFSIAMFLFGVSIMPSIYGVIREKLSESPQKYTAIQFLLPIIFFIFMAITA